MLKLLVGGALQCATSCEVLAEMCHKAVILHIAVLLLMQRLSGMLRKEQKVYAV